MQRTWPRLAAATGSGVISDRMALAVSPSSSSISCSAISVGNGCSLSCSSANVCSQRKKTSELIIFLISKPARTSTFWHPSPEECPQGLFEPAFAPHGRKLRQHRTQFTQLQGLGTLPICDNGLAMLGGQSSAPPSRSVAAGPAWTTGPAQSSRMMGRATAVRCTAAAPSVWSSARAGRAHSPA